MYINCFVPASAISKTSNMHGYMIFIINIINLLIYTSTCNIITLISRYTGSV